MSSCAKTTRKEKYELLTEATKVEPPFFVSLLLAFIFTFLIQILLFYQYAITNIQQVCVLVFT